MTAAAPLDVLTPAEVAGELRCSDDTVHRLIASGDLPAIRISSRVLRVQRSALAAYIDARTQHGDQLAPRRRRRRSA
jgi:excisionase family DNA binding protein